jgi:hypothetical protein
VDTSKYRAYIGEIYQSRGYFWVSQDGENLKTKHLFAFFISFPEVSNDIFKKIVEYSQEMFLPSCEFITEYTSREY